MTRTGLRLFSACVRLLMPRDFRERYGADLLATFGDGYSAARSHSILATLAFLLRELWALGRAAPGEWRALTEAESIAHPQSPRGFMKDIARDVVYAFRMIGRAPQYAVVIVLTLALGIGLNLAVWTLLNSVLLRPLPYQAEEQLFQIWNRMVEPAHDAMTIAPADYLDLKARARSFSDLAAHNSWYPTIGEASNAERVEANRVTPNLFRTLGVKPALGRDFVDGENMNDGDRLVLLSHRAWSRWFDLAPDVVGRKLLIGTTSYEVIGVLPAGYRHADPHNPLRDAQLFVPFDFAPRG